MHPVDPPTRSARRPVRTPPATDAPILNYAPAPLRRVSILQLSLAFFFGAFLGGVIFDCVYWLLFSPTLDDSFVILLVLTSILTAYGTAAVALTALLFRKRGDPFAHGWLIALCGGTAFSAIPAASFTLSDRGYGAGIPSALIVGFCLTLPPACALLAARFRA